MTERARLQYESYRNTSTSSIHSGLRSIPSIDRYRRHRRLATRHHILIAVSSAPRSHYDESFLVHYVSSLIALQILSRFSSFIYLCIIHYSIAVNIIYKPRIQLASIFHPNFIIVLFRSFSSSSLRVHKREGRKLARDKKMHFVILDCTAKLIWAVLYSAPFPRIDLPLSGSLFSTLSRSIKAVGTAEDWNRARLPQRVRLPNLLLLSLCTSPFRVSSRAGFSAIDAGGRRAVARLLLQFSRREFQADYDSLG